MDLNLMNRNLIFSVAILAAAIIIPLILKKAGRGSSVFTSNNVILAGVALSSVFMFFPIYRSSFGKGIVQWFESGLLSIHNTIRLFFVDGDFDFITNHIPEKSGALGTAYTVFFAILFVAAPVLTFGFVLSFFKNLTAYRKYYFSYFKDVYIFSELNDKSITLAKSLLDSEERRVCVFTDVFEKNEESSFELIGQANDINAILFKNDISAIKFGKHSKNHPVNFFFIGEDEGENVRQALDIAPKYKDKVKGFLYVFSRGTDSEIVFSNYEDGDLQIRRIDPVYSLISSNLYNKGFEMIYEKLLEEKNYKTEITSTVSAVVVGLGNYGTEMLRSLPWFCQMFGVRAEINAYDIDEHASEKFRVLCPDIVNEEYNGNFTNYGESQYSLKIHDKVDVDTAGFYEELKKIPAPTYIFVALNDEKKNIDVAMRLRSFCEREGFKNTNIQTVVYDSNRVEALKDAKFIHGEKYKKDINIDFVGDIKSLYSEDTIISSELEKKALGRHASTGDKKEREFYRNEYDRRSSIASVTHAMVRKKCRMPQADIPAAERDEKERDALRVLEHRRWNAYVRGQGFVFSKNKDWMSYTHDCLKNFEDLNPEIQAYDDVD